MMLKIGMIVCAHGNAKAVARLCKAYGQENVDVIALCGDLGDDFKEISAVMHAASSKKVKVIAFPGSHEPEKDFAKALRKHKRVIDGIKTRRLSVNGYDIVTLPGSSVNVSHASFRIADKKLPAGYLRQFRVFFINQLARFIKNAKKTVVLCHDPPRGSSPKGIDVAYSGVVAKTFILKSKDVGIFGKQWQKALRTNPLALINQKGQIITEPYASLLAKRGYPVSVKHRNVGNDALKAFLKKHKIAFFGCGHIHEAGHRAVNAAGKPLKKGDWSSSVWYNAAPAVEGNGGILIIDGEQATFKNIKVKS